MSKMQRIRELEDSLYRERAYFHSHVTALEASNAALSAAQAARDSMIEELRATIVDQSSSIRRLRQTFTEPAARHYFTLAIVDLVSQQIKANRASVLEMNDAAAAVAGGRAAALGERIASLCVGLDKIKTKSPDLATWVRDELAVWVARTQDAGPAAGATHSGWVAEAHEHVKFLQSINPRGAMAGGSYTPVS